MNKLPEISIIIANYNGESYLPTCLGSVVDTAHDSFEVIIVDDSSMDKSIKIIKSFMKKDRRIKLFVNNRNLGASASRNKAIGKAQGNILIFLDNDTQVKKNWLKELIKPLDKKNVGAAQSLLIDFDSRDKVQMAGGKLIPHTAWLGADFVEKNYKDNKNKIRKTEIVAISASLAVKKEVIETVGYFDEMEAVTTEDLDFCWRIWIAGFKIVLAPNSIVYHKTKTVKERQNMNSNDFQIYYHLAKNSMRSIIKNYQLKNVLRYLPYTILVNYGRAFVILLRKGDLSAFRGTNSAVLWNLKCLKNTLKERVNVQNSRKVDDEFLFGTIFLQDGILSIYSKYFSGR